MPVIFPFCLVRAPQKLAFSLLAGGLLPFAGLVQASNGAWDYVCMVDTAADTGQEVGYVCLHVDLPIQNGSPAITTTAKPAVTATTVKPATVKPAAVTANAASVAARPELTATEAAIASVATIAPNAEQTVLNALSGDGNFDHAVTIVAAEAHAKRQALPGLAEFLLARRAGDTEGFKQWTLNSRALQIKAGIDGASGATALTYRQLVAELRVQVKLGPDYRTVIAGLGSRRDSDFRAAIDKVILATKAESNGGIDYGNYVSEVLNSLKNRKAPVPYTQRSKDAGLTNSAQ